MNPMLERRIDAMFGMLTQVDAAGMAMSASSRGTEREIFVRGFLQQVFPAHFRFSSGDITDGYGKRSGQVDVVVENPSGFSFPVAPDGPRLFLAETVAVAVEIKSDLKSQWAEVLATAKGIRKLRRHSARQAHDGLVEIASMLRSRGGFDGQIGAWLKGRRTPDDALGERIPVIAVGYRGWKTDDAERSQVMKSKGLVQGVFNIECRRWSTLEGVQSGSESMLRLLDLLSAQLKRVSEALPATSTYAAPPFRGVADDILREPANGRTSLVAVDPDWMRKPKVLPSTERRRKPRASRSRG